MEGTRSELYYNLLEKYSKYIVHMRQQFDLAPSKLGIVLGAGISINIGLPDWNELVAKISQRDDIIKLGITIDLKNDPISNAQLLFQAYKASKLKNASANSGKTVRLIRTNGALSSVETVHV